MNSTLAVRRPFDPVPALGSLIAHAVPGVEVVEGGTVRRVVRLGGVPSLVEATLDAPAVSRRAEWSEGPERSERSERPEQSELPRRRPSGGTRRRDAASPEGRGARRRAPEEEVLSDWMSAEIAHRPAGRHATPGHRDRPADGEPSGRSRRRGIGTGRERAPGRRPGPDRRDNRSGPG